MQENLVIVESPAKAKTIEKFLGERYKVMSSYGHIRDLKKKELSINDDSLVPEYEIPEEKKKLVQDLKKAAQKAEKIWLASDEDREGEAISWHLAEVLGLDEEKTNRIVFHEITKPAILEAIEHPRKIDMNLVNAQQARRILDRIVGFKISPILWRKVKPALSAGRVQSVAVRLIVEREREIQEFKVEPYYKIFAILEKENADGSITEIHTELDTKFTTYDEALLFMQNMKEAEFKIEEISRKPVKRTPPPPFTTSTLQQEAARKLGFTVAQTMMVAQHLYENGKITYMRTDSVNLSNLCIGAAKNEVMQNYGEEYTSPRKYRTKAKGAQEAHEAIRPTNMQAKTIEGTSQEKRLYNLIWKRTIASQMAEAQIEKTTVNIAVTGSKQKFVATGEVIKFDGYLKVYKETTDDESTEQTQQLPKIKVGDALKRREISTIEKYSQTPVRYTEASLVHKLEELGIGRPSTYAPTINTIQNREYVIRGDKKGEERRFKTAVLKGNKITEKEKKEIVGNEKGKLIPTDIGIVVNDFLIQNFPNIMDYHFTAKVEDRFDSIAQGKKEWNNMIKEFYKDFSPTVDHVMNARSEHKAGERLIGNDPKTGEPVYVKIGRFGPVVQIGEVDNKNKPRFAQLPADKSITSITLDEALELFKLPRTVGEYEGEEVKIGVGKYGPYIYHAKKYVSIPKTEDPYTIDLEKAISVIDEKRSQEEQKHIKIFDTQPTMEILNGRYGPYITCEGKNYRIPKNKQENIQELTAEDCMEIIRIQNEKSKNKKS